MEFIMAFNTEHHRLPSPFHHLAFPRSFTSDISSFPNWYIPVSGRRSTCPYITFPFLSCLVEEMSSYSFVPFPSFSRAMTYLLGPLVRLLMTFLIELRRFPASVQKKLVMRIHSTPPAASFRLSASE